MPNWCVNAIIAKTENSARLNEFKDFMKDFTCDKIIPMPETFRDYDTANHPNGDGLKIGDKYHSYFRGSKYENETVITKELIEEFKQATEEQDNKYGVVGWYDWSVEYWGTKWDIDPEDIEITELDGGKYVRYRFETAWTPIVDVFQKLQTLFPDIELEMAYYETGEWFCGNVQPDGTDWFVNNPDYKNMILAQLVVDGDLDFTIHIGCDDNNDYWLNITGDCCDCEYDDMEFYAYSTGDTTEQKEIFTEYHSVDDINDIIESIETKYCTKE